MALQGHKNQIMRRFVCSWYNNFVIFQFKNQYYLSLLIDKNFYTVRTWHRSPSALNRCMLLQKSLFHRLLAMWTRHSGKLTMCQMILGKEKGWLQNWSDLVSGNQSFIGDTRRQWHYLTEFSPLNVWAPFYWCSQGWSSEQSVKESPAWQSYQETAALLTALHCPQGTFVLHHFMQEDRQKLILGTSHAHSTTNWHLFCITNMTTCLVNIDIVKLAWTRVTEQVSNQFLPDGLLNAVLAESMTTGRLNCIPQSH